MSGFHIIIPARMASERLPGKPLADIGGRSLIEWVYRRALQSTADSVTIATDSEDILAAAQSFGAKAVMTSPHHASGSDRIAECADEMGLGNDAVIVNLQGDEPLMPAPCLEQVAVLLQQQRQAAAASLYWPVEGLDEATDPNVVKVVVDTGGRALYFSRSVIPHPRSEGEGWKRHIGLYAYRAGALREYTSMAPSPLEQTEKLEQLRFLEAGREIVMARACELIPAGVDTPEDLERVRLLLE
jgi:3-deoxy-manno-octulosonate cytidylyltransferase (CMP-KDO synthetase)